MRFASLYRGGSSKGHKHRIAGEQEMKTKYAAGKRIVALLGISEVVLLLSGCPNLFDSGDGGSDDSNQNPEGGDGGSGNIALVGTLLHPFERTVMCLGKIKHG